LDTRATILTVKIALRGKVANGGIPCKRTFKCLSHLLQVFFFDEKFIYSSEGILFILVVTFKTGVFREWYLKFGAKFSGKTLGLLRKGDQIRSKFRLIQS